MTSVRTKTRQRPKKWVLAFYRAVGEFKNGERQMMRMGHARPITYRNKKLAMKGKCRNWKEPFKAFIYMGRKPRKVIEIQVYDPDQNYPAE